jgi:hypothetical protein
MKAIDDQPLTDRSIKQFQARIEEHHRRALAKDAEENANMVFLASAFMQCTLPHKDPGKIAVWSRTNNLITLKIESGRDARTDELLGIPFGIIPRLLEFYLNTEAVRTRSRTIKFGRQLAKFMRQIGLDPDSYGKRSDYKRMIEQANRLFTARITIVDNRQLERHLPPRKDMLVAEEQDLWWSPHNADQTTIFESHIVLSERIYEAFTSNPVPVDFQALKMLKRSPLALDLYGWCAYRINDLKQPLTIPLAALQHQFGAEYTIRTTDENGQEHLAPNRKEFNRKFRQAMVKVQQAYPALKYGIEEGTITLFPSATPIQTRHAK